MKKIFIFILLSFVVVFNAYAVKKTTVGSANSMKTNGSATITISNTLPTTLNGSSLDLTTYLTTSGGGTGAITITIDSASQSICSVSNATITPVGSGDCTFTVTKSASAGFDSKSISKTIAVTPPPPPGTPSSGTPTNTFPQWAYFAQSVALTSAGQTTASSKCATIGSGWRLPTYGETGPASYIAWLDSNIGRGVQFINSTGVTNLQGAGWTTNYNYPIGSWGSNYTVSKIVCYHS